MIQIFDIYVRTTRSLLQQINIRWCREIIQRYMLANTDFNNISIDNQKWEILPTLVLADNECVTQHDLSDFPILDLTTNW